MRHWRDVDQMAFETFVSPDGLHMNDWSYACMAKGLGSGHRRSRAARPVASCRRLRLPLYDRVLTAASDFIQRRQQILDHVVGVLEPGRKPHQPVADAELGALLRRQPLMRRRRRMRDQALGVAEIVGDADELERVEEAERACLAAFDLERASASSRPSSAS